MTTAKKTTTKKTNATATKNQAAKKYTTTSAEYETRPVHTTPAEYETRPVPVAIVPLIKFTADKWAALQPEEKLTLCYLFQAAENNVSHLAARMANDSRVRELAKILIDDTAKVIKAVESHDYASEVGGKIADLIEQCCNTDKAGPCQMKILSDACSMLTEISSGREAPLPDSTIGHFEDIYNQEVTGDGAVNYGPSEGEQDAAEAIKAELESKIQELADMLAAAQTEGANEYATKNKALGKVLDKLNTVN